LRSNLSARDHQPRNFKPRRASTVVGRPLALNRARPLIDTALLQHFETYLQQHALSPVTIRNYLADLRAFARWHAARTTHALAFASADFRAFRDYLCNETDHSPATVNRRLQSLRLFGRFLHEKGHAPDNPTREIALLRNGNENSSAPRTLTRAETDRLLNALAAARPSLAKRDVAIVHLMLQAGLRVHEIAALRVEDVAITRNRAQVQVRGNRQGEQRTVPLKPVAARALRAYLAVRPAIPHVEQLFLSQRGEPLSVRSVQRLVDAYARAAGLDAVSAQSLRHTCAKRMLEETRDPARVAQWLGQRSVKGLDRYTKNGIRNTAHAKSKS